MSEKNISFHTWLIAKAKPGDLIQIFEYGECIGALLATENNDLYEDILSKNLLAKTVKDVSYGWNCQINENLELIRCVRVDVTEE